MHDQKYGPYLPTFYVDGVNSIEKIELETGRPESTLVKMRFATLQKNGTGQQTSPQVEICMTNQNFRRLVNGLITSIKNTNSNSAPANEPLAKRDVSNDFAQTIDDPIL